MIEVVPCKLAHIRCVARNLRQEERDEIALVTGRPKRHLMIALWLQSTYSRALILDGEVAAVGGDSAPALSLEGHGWLFTTPLVEKLSPIRFFRLVQEQLDELQKVRVSVRSSILARSERCARFYDMLDFYVSEPMHGFRDIVLGG